MDIVNTISKSLNINEKNVESAVNLIHEGCTIPFIARYRKEVTGYLDDIQLRNIDEKLKYLTKLDERITTVLNSIEEQGKLSDELRVQIENVETLNELEDLYRPYKPKKKTRAILAKEKGLEPLAKFILIHDKSISLDEKSLQFLNESKGVNTIEDAIQGAKDILAELISDEARYRTYIKKYIYRFGLIKSKELQKDEKDTYHQYADYSEQISKIPPHRFLAINRGCNVKCLKYSFEYEVDDIKSYIGKNFIKNDIYDDIFNEIINDSLKRLILPSVENEIYNDLFDKSQEASFIVFKNNLKALLMYPPLKNKVVLGFDPGFRTGCKYALVDENGRLKFIGHSYITANSNEAKLKSINELTKILLNNKIDYIALGNGTASRESEVVLKDILTKNNIDTKLFIVNESGASVYSASKLGQEEFPNLNVEERSAISLARRLQDPLSELVKIDPKAIGVGQYQHDMDQTRLGEILSTVVEDCVNSVGVDVNTASVSLLKYVSGINKTLANNIFDYIKVNGPFKNRSELLKVSKMGDKAYEQCIGFLRILDGDEVLDRSAIHPESYKYAKLILKETSIDLINDSISIKEDKLKSFNKEKFIKETSIGSATLDDMLLEIIKPGRDIRDEVELVSLNNEVKSIEDLKVGMILEGTVRNIMDFGAFIDINVHQDGLVHISEVSNSYIKNISDVLSINQLVKVKVISVDIQKKRIGLSIKQAK